jgi:hypothetical protein
MGEGVRELAELPDGVSVNDPSSDPWKGESTLGAIFRLEDRVAMFVAAFGSLRGAFGGKLGRCFGAGGGLLSLGTKSTIGRICVSILY